MTLHITLEQAMRIARLAVGGDVEVRDFGLLQSALDRPAAVAFGEDAYPDLWSKAAALLESLVSNHPLVDGNKRLGWLATWVFLAKNGTILDPDDDAAYELVMSVASGELSGVPEIAVALKSL